MIITTIDEKPKTYQVPKADHPWRNYPDKKRGRPVDRADVISIREFLIEIVENWDTYEVYDRTSFSDGGFRKIKALPQKKVALWLASMVKKVYVDQL